VSPIRDTNDSLLLLIIEPSTMSLSMLFHILILRGVSAWASIVSLGGGVGRT